MGRGLSLSFLSSAWWICPFINSVQKGIFHLLSAGKRNSVDLAWTEHKGDQTIDDWKIVVHSLAHTGDSHRYFCVHGFSICGWFYKWDSPENYPQRGLTMWEFGRRDFRQKKDEITFGYNASGWGIRFRWSRGNWSRPHRHSSYWKGIQSPAFCWSC